MSPSGRPKGESRKAQPEGTPVSPPAVPVAPDIPTDIQVRAPAATLDRSTAGTWVLAGAWTVNGLGALADTAAAAAAGEDGAVAPLPGVLDGSALVSIDSAGAWVLRRMLQGQQGQQGQQDRKSVV